MTPITQDEALALAAEVARLRGALESNRAAWGAVAKEAAAGRVRDQASLCNDAARMQYDCGLALATHSPAADEVRAAVALAEAILAYKHARDHGPDNKTFDAAFRQAEAAEVVYRQAKAARA